MNTGFVAIRGLLVSASGFATTGLNLSRQSQTRTMSATSSR